MCRAVASSITRTVAPLYGLIVTRPVPASVLSASRTGVLETPRTPASSVSTSAWPGLSSPERMACLIASKTAVVRDGGGAAEAASRYVLISGISYTIPGDVTPAACGRQRTRTGEGVGKGAQ